MVSFGNEASSHSGLIPLKTAYEKRRELLWAIASKENFIREFKQIATATSTTAVVDAASWGEYVS